MKSKVAGLVSLLLTISCITLSRAEATYQDPRNVDKIGFESSGDLSFPINGIRVMHPYKSERDFLCSSLDDSRCTAVDTSAWVRQNLGQSPGSDEIVGINYVHHLPLCSEIILTDCLTDLFARLPDGKVVNGQFVRKLFESTSGDFRGDPKVGLSDGIGRGLIVRFPGVNHEGGTDLYLVSVINIGVPSEIKKSGISLRDTKVVSESFEAYIVPYLEGVRNATPSPSCISWIPVPSESNCAISVDHPIGVRYGLTIRFPDKLSGWFHGRMKSPIIQTTVQQNQTSVSIEGLPMTLPVIDEMYDKSSIPSALMELLVANMNNPLIGSRYAPWLGLQIGIGGGSTHKGNSLDLLESIYPVLGDKATKEMSLWSVKTLQGDMGVIRGCESDLAGIITTNALSYRSGPPIFNETTQSLDYTVSSTHLTSKGDVVAGSYDLVVRADIVRCLYKFSSAPIKATIEVLSSDGGSKIATTAVNERNGWLSLSAQGFEYSNPTIRVKVSQEGSSTSAGVESPAKETIATAPRPLPSASPVPKKSNLRTITCAKNATKKRVTAQKPKCPRGYRAVS